MAALDADGNGEISTEEIKVAPAALKKLDKNNDGKLTDAELLPSFPGGGGSRGGSVRGGRSRWSSAGPSPHLKAMTDRSHPEEARIAENAANEVSVEESAVNAKANAVVVPPVPANRKTTLSESPLAKRLANGLFMVSRLDPFPLGRRWPKAG